MSDAHALTCKAGTVLFRPDDPCRGFVSVETGAIRVMLTAENGREIVLYRVQPGEICLQTFNCLIGDQPYSAEGVAEGDLKATIIPPEEFRRRIAEDAAFRDQIFSAVALRFSDLEQLVEDVALTGLSARLARLLLRRADPSGRVEATHLELAVEAGSGRAVVSRMLGHFADDALVSLTRGHIVIVDKAALERLAHEA